MTTNAERIEQLREPSHGYQFKPIDATEKALAEAERKIAAVLAEVNAIDAMVAEHLVTVEVSIALQLVSRGLRAALTITAPVKIAPDSLHITATCKGLFATPEKPEGATS